MPAWPSTLPQIPDGDGYAESIGYPIVEAAVTGPPLTRRRFTASPKAYTASFLMTSTQLATFELFFRDDIGQGALAYDWRERGVATNPLESFRIVGPPQLQYVGGIYWRVGLSLIRLP